MIFGEESPESLLRKADSWHHVSTRNGKSDSLYNTIEASGNSDARSLFHRDDIARWLNYLILGSLAQDA